MYKGLIKLFLILNSNQKPWQITGAASMGCLLAFIPGGNLLWIILFLVFLLLRVNKAIGLLFLLLFRLAAPLYDPIFESLGFSILSIEKIKPFWIKLYDIPFVPFSSFNDSQVLGGLIGGLILFIPIMIIFRLLINAYRKKMIPLWHKSKIYKKLKALPWFNKLASAVGASKRAFEVGRR